jgi:ribosomal protein S18 acetylase RimI-like enzyme
MMTPKLLKFKLHKHLVGNSNSLKLINKFEIHEAKIGDGRALRSLEEECFDYDQMSQRVIRNHIRSGTSIFLVGKQGQKIVGYALLFLRKNSRIARLYSLAIAEEFRGKGLAKRLLLKCESKVLGQNKSTLRLEVKENHKAAIQLYTKLGYNEIRRLPHYYQDRTNAIQMEKQLKSKKDKV